MDSPLLVKPYGFADENPAETELTTFFDRMRKLFDVATERANVIRQDLKYDPNRQIVLLIAPNGSDNLIVVRHTPARNGKCSTIGIFEGTTSVITKTRLPIWSVYMSEDLLSEEHQQMLAIFTEGTPLDPLQDTEGNAISEVIRVVQEEKMACTYFIVPEWIPTK